MDGYRSAWPALAVLCFLPGVVWGQSAVGSLSGIVLDPSGGVVAGAQARLESLVTGRGYQTETTARGLFRMEHLPPGRYAFTLQAKGFRQYQIPAVTLLPGQQVDLSLSLQIADTQESVTVRGEVAEIERVAANGTRSGAFTSSEVSALPMVAGTAGRNYRALAYQLPGVGLSKATHAPLTVNGNRPVGTMNVMVDSAEFNDVIAGNLLGRGTTEQPVSMEAVETMEFATSNFKAEYGRASGGVINLVTRSGGNTWHASAYNFFQNSALNARNALLEEKPPLRANLPGVNAGGPVRKNLLFLFGSAEISVRDMYRSSSIVTTLTPEQRAAAAPAVRALTRLYPEVNVGTNLNSASIPTPNTSRYGLLRTDWNISARHRGTFRTNFANSVGGFRERLWAGDADSGNRLVSMVASIDSVLSTRIFNQARATYTQSYSEVRPYYPSLGDPAVNGQVGLLVVTGLPLVGQFRPPSETKFQNRNLADDLAVVAGRHTWKAGFIYRWLAPSTTSDRGFNGTLVFPSIAGFLAAQPVSYTRSLGISRIDLRASEISGYVQDDWRLLPQLTLNLGLRYEKYSVPVEHHGRLGELYSADSNNFAPRLGFAYRIKAATVIRGGYGVFFTPVQMEFIGQARFAPPLVTSYSRARPQFPNLLAGAAIGSDRSVLDRGLRQPYTQNWNLTIERQVKSPGTMVSVAYVGNRGLKLPRASRPNGGENLTAAQRPDPQTGVVTFYSTSAASSYHGLQMSLRSTLGSRLTMRAAYSYSKAIDDVSDTAQFPVDERNWRLERALADFHQPHLLSCSAVYRLPFRESHRWLGGWELSGLLAGRSGTPYSLLSNTNNPSGTLNNRIDHVDGAIIRQSSGSSWFRLAPGVAPSHLQPLGRPGTLGRNTERAPRFASVDLALRKPFLLTERWRIELRGEAYNLFNTVNYDAPANNIGNPVFGSILTANEARQLQILLRLSF